MACFLVSVAEAVVVKVAEKAAKQNELRALEMNTEKAKEVPCVQSLRKQYEQPKRL